MGTDTLKERLDGWLEELKGALEQGRTGGFLSVLEGMGRFHQYSARNVILIQMQRPDATLVAGIKRWNEMGRRVKRGEKGIAILAPTVRRVREKDETGEEKVVERVVGFHTVYVFDISQTEGEPVLLGREVPGAEGIYDRLRACCPVPVREEPLGVGHYGFTDGKRIVLSSFLSRAARAETLIHEWGHVLLHKDGEGSTAAVRELEAEAVAYAVGRELGLPMEGSRDYILHWRGTVEALEAALERISRAARGILKALEGVGEAVA